ncbi:hypothetical protein HYW43_01555, partial [Candidatus Daviesbacteria bacterium]|nr:hypothetical protein [Candidatus Daviesbacteria bacterium]
MVNFAKISKWKKLKQHTQKKWRYVPIVEAQIIECTEDSVGLSSPVRNLHLMTARQNETLSLRNTAAKQVMKGVSYSSFLYGPNTDPYLEYADVTRRFSSAYHQAIGSETSSTERGLVKSVHASETWTTSIRDISLVDLERMPLPLDEARIGRVGKFLRYHWLSFLISNQHIAQEIALLLPTQSLARSRFLDKSHDRPLPPHLDDLAKRMTGFMDFYLPLLTEPWATQDNLFNLGVNFAWIGQHLWKAFGHYIPARMGLSPSSSTKLIEARLEDLTFLGADKPVKRVVYNELKDAFRPDSLPAHLHPFLQYDVITDREAGLQLAEYYSNYAANKQEDLNHLIDRL